MSINRSLAAQFDEELTDFSLNRLAKDLKSARDTRALHGILSTHASTLEHHKAFVDNLYEHLRESIKVGHSLAGAGLDEFAQQNGGAIPIELCSAYKKGLEDAATAHLAMQEELYVANFVGRAARSRPEMTRLSLGCPSSAYDHGQGELGRSGLGRGQSANNWDQSYVNQSMPTQNSGLPSPPDYSVDGEAQKGRHDSSISRETAAYGQHTGSPVLLEGEIPELTPSESDSGSDDSEFAPCYPCYLSDFRNSIHMPDTKTGRNSPWYRSILAARYGDFIPSQYRPPSVYDRSRE